VDAEEVARKPNPDTRTAPSSTNLWARPDRRAHADRLSADGRAPGQPRGAVRGQLRLRTFGAQCGGTPHEADDPSSGPGTYRVPGVDLIASCTGDYEADGLLVWFPGEQSYGVWDSSHDYILLFSPEVTWSRIAASPAEHINAQWAFEDLTRAPAKFLVPWPKYPFRG
jgi:hypothetical protein